MYINLYGRQHNFTKWSVYVLVLENQNLKNMFHHFHLQEQVRTMQEEHSRTSNLLHQQLESSETKCDHLQRQLAATTASLDQLRDSSEGGGTTTTMMLPSVHTAGNHGTLHSRNSSHGLGGEFSLGAAGLSASSPRHTERQAGEVGVTFSLVILLWLEITWRNIPHPRQVNHQYLYQYLCLFV